MEILDLFGGGVLVRDREHALISLLRGHSLGTIDVPSGRLIAGDAYALDDARAIEVPAGQHEVVVGASEMDAGHDVTGLFVRVRAGKVARWSKLRALGVDGAAVAFADAAAAKRLDRDRWHEKLGALEAPLGAARLHRSVAVAMIGSDGGFPLRAGWDARDHLVALAITAKDPKKLVAWPGRGSDVPAVDATDLDACLAWARRMGGDGAIVRPGKTDLAPLRTIRKIPAELRRYYATHTPYLEGDIEAFRRMVERHSLGRALPVAVDGEDSLVYQREDDLIVNLYQGSTMGTSLDLRAWALLSTIAVHDLATR